MLSIAVLIGVAPMIYKNANEVKQYVIILCREGHQIMSFFKLIIRHTGAGLAPFSQTVGSLLRFPWPTKRGRKMDLPLKKWIVQNPNLTLLHITLLHKEVHQIMSFLNS